MFRARRSDQARPLLERSLDLARREGMVDVVAASANNLGNLMVAARQPAEAVSFYDESIEAARRARDDSLSIMSRANKAGALAQTGRREDALRLLRDKLPAAL